ncbi:GNAT family N-acetyltransferase [uncultured Friedmanniella sp.]|uniref:GNAT family N-acetyltransferase n=1 Tax=uncultured Friedmanniella sp. TaxID=335381 RepID=UPI0035C9AA2D
MSARDPAPIRLVDVDETVLDELVALATTDASADEVTPSVTSGSSWTIERIAWLRDYHRGCRSGLDGSKGEATWAVVVGGQAAGSVRLKRTEIAGVVETGIWLARRARGNGYGSAAVVAVV